MNDLKKMFRDPENKGSSLNEWLSAEYSAGMAFLNDNVYFTHMVVVQKGGSWIWLTKQGKRILSVTVTTRGPYHQPETRCALG